MKLWNGRLLGERGAGSDEDRAGARLGALDEEDQMELIAEFAGKQCAVGQRRTQRARSQVGSKKAHHGAALGSWLRTSGQEPVVLSGVEHESGAILRPAGNHVEILDAQRGIDGVRWRTQQNAPDL